MPTIGDYRVTYSCRDFGTERVLTVQDHLDRIIGQRDPFWPGGNSRPIRRSVKRGSPPWRGRSSTIMSGRIGPVSKPP
jgi:hypothetical protein